MENLFKEDLRSKDFFEVADWLKKVRATVKEEDFEGHNTPQEAYKEALIKHFQEWNNHEKDEEKFYDSEVFNKANVLLTLEETCFKYIMFTVQGKKRQWKISYDEAIYIGLMSPSQVQENKICLVNEYIAALEALDGDETIENIIQLRKMVCKVIDIHKTHTIIQIKFVDMKHLESIKDYRDIKKYLPSKDYAIEIEQGGAVTTIELLDLLNENEIAKQTYYNYKNWGAEVEIGKKFFINLGIFLVLNKNQLEPLLNKEGYTLEYSQKNTDRIVWQCIKQGTGRGFVEELLRLQCTLSINKRDFQNRMPSLAFILFYFDQTPEKQNELHTLYQKAFEVTDSKMTNFLEKINEKTVNSYERIKRLKQKIYHMEEEKWYMKAVQYELGEDKVKEKIENEALMSGWELGDLSRDIIEPQFRDINYVEKYIERLERQIESEKLLAISEEEKSKNISSRIYEIKDLFTNYKSRGNYSSKEVEKYVDAVERLTFTIEDVKNYLSKKKKEDREALLRNMLS